MRPINIIIDAPIVRNLHDTISFYLKHDGSIETADSIKYTWYKDSVALKTNSKIILLGKELKINDVTKFDEGMYQCVVTNKYGQQSSKYVKLSVPCNPPAAPVVNANLVVCQNASVGNFSVTANNGSKLLWYGTNEVGGVATANYPVLSSAVVGTNNYFVSQIDTLSGCEGPRASVSLIVNPTPIKPVIKRDSSNYITTSSYGTIWFKDGVQISDTLQQIKPNSSGLYSAKTVINGCTSLISENYFYLVTDLLQLSNDEYIKISPNPFVNKIVLDFRLKNINKLNIEILELSSGNIITNRKDNYSGTQIYLGQISSGVFVVKISSSDLKIVHQLKMIKF